MSKAEWDEYFKRVRAELDAEKNKSSASPLTKYPKNTIASLISESKKDCKCILCNKPDFVEPVINYDLIDNNKIMRLEKILEDESYDFTKFAISVKYWVIKKKLEPVEYSKDVDFETTLNNYNEETNNLYTEIDTKRREYDSLNKDLTQISDLMNAKEKYDLDKQCIDITSEYIDQAKAHFAKKIVERAKEIITTINTRYTDLFIVDGVYKAIIWNEDFTEEKELPVQSLSNGEKTSVALSLILAIRDLFMPNLPLVMDESFVNLDANNLDQVKQIIHSDSSQWIIVSHDERLL